MPIYEYEAKDPAGACERCRQRFENLERMAGPPLLRCPRCGAEIVRLISAPAVGASKCGFDDRAKSAGFHKLQRLGKGEYERKY